MLTIKTQNQVGETDVNEDPAAYNEDLNIPYVHNYREFLRLSKAKFNEDIKQKAENSPLKISNFDLVRTVGTGSFGRVVIAKLKNTSKVYAIKIIPKEKVVVTGQVKHLLNERNILRSIQFPFIIHLNTSFHDSTFIYLVMPYLNGGELFFHLRHIGKMTEPNARFYAGQICLALEFLHYLKIIYRDLKPENIVFDSNGDVKFVDFGFAKVIKSRTWTLCGTPDYIAPEMLLNRGYSFSVDVWSFGVLLYELNSGQPPFKDKNTLYLYEKILKARYTFPSQFSAELKDLISKILVVNVTKRICGSDSNKDDIKNHKWFNDLKWEALLNRTIQPPFIPKVSNQLDSSNFERFEEKEIVVLEEDRYKSIFRDF